MKLNRLKQFGRKTQMSVILQLNSKNFTKLLFEDKYSSYQYLYVNNVCKSVRSEI